MKGFLVFLICVSFSIGALVFYDQYKVSQRWQKEAITTYNQQVKDFYSWKTSTLPKPQEWWFRETWFNTACAWVQLFDGIISMFGVIIPTSILLYQRRKT